MLKTNVLAYSICQEIFHFELGLGIQHANSLKLEQQIALGIQIAYSSLQCQNGMFFVNVRE